MSGDGPGDLTNRRQFIKRGIMGGCGVAVGAWAVHDLFLGQSGGSAPRSHRAFLNDAPRQPTKWSREAAWWDAEDGFVHCRLCPHQCVLADGDRGFCRSRAVIDDTLYTLVYGNPCSVHVDPMEKKPLYHFLPGQPILSLATAGCNLRCLNCQNWEISQSRPQDVESGDLPPEALVDYAVRKGIPALAYTYSEPIVFYEYVRDTAALARERGIRNVLVTAGYIEEAPLRSLCDVVDAANVDLKSFDEGVYARLVGGALKPVLRALEVMKEEGVWVEVTRLIVPGHSDDVDDIRRQCEWMVATLGPDTPLHLSRFHPAHQLQGLPPTPVAVLDQAYELAKSAGLHQVFVGNVAGHGAQDTHCPACGLPVIERRGYEILHQGMEEGRCICGAPIPGVWL